MPKKPRSTRPEGTLDQHDAELWEQVTRSAEPLKADRNRAPRRATAIADEPSIEAKSLPKQKKAAPAGQSEPRARQPAPPPLGGFDRREAKGLGAGRIEIDARIDLHGMRQREAHVALRVFIQRSHERGHRHVLVITGKGAPRGSPGDDDFYAERRDTPGVLRRAVPLWLDEPELRGWVVSFTQASPRHGGEGALYVRLRRPGRASADITK